jgi:phosphatidylserine/phosphatidylglycerophosphate/cardiolipin synthase-like enzyme
MIVAYFQIAIVALLLGVHFVGQVLKRVTGLQAIVGTTVVAIALTIFTLVMVFTSRLLILQLVVIWGTWLALSRFSSKNSKIEKLNRRLNDALGDLSSDIMRRASDSLGNDSHHRVIVGAKHREVLERAIDEVRNDLTIFSGWIATRVVDRAFVKRLTAALDRGANVQLVFGYQSPGGAQREDHAHASAVRQLRALAATKKKGALKLHDLSQATASKFGNHAKLLICDRSYVVCGSNNWLANRKFANAEMSILLVRQDIVDDIREAVERLLSEVVPSPIAEKR